MNVLIARAAFLWREMTGVAKWTLFLNNRLWVEAQPTSYYVIINQLLGGFS